MLENVSNAIYIARFDESTQHQHVHHDAVATVTAVD